MRGIKIVKVVDEETGKEISSSNSGIKIVRVVDEETGNQLKKKEFTQPSSTQSLPDTPILRNLTQKPEQGQNLEAGKKPVQQKQYKDPYEGTILAGNLTNQFEKSQKSITGELMDKNEEFVVPKLNYEYGQYGFVFEEATPGFDAMSVKASNGKTLDVSLKANNKFASLEESNKLKKFLEENKSASKIIGDASKINKQTQKIQNESEILKAVKALNTNSEKFKGDINKFSLLYDGLKKEYDDNFKNLDSKSIEYNPELKAKCT